MRRVRGRVPTLGTVPLFILLGIVLVGLFLLSSGWEFVVVSQQAFAIVFLLVILGSVIGISSVWYVARLRYLRTKALSIADIDSMTGVEFEKYCALLLRSRGYHTRMTSVSGDLGVDIIATKNNVKSAIQLKRYSGPVSRNAVSDAVAGMAYYGCSNAMVITNNYFTVGAQTLAKSNNCVLIDREVLSCWVLEFQKMKK